MIQTSDSSGDHNALLPVASRHRHSTRLSQCHGLQGTDPDEFHNFSCSISSLRDEEEPAYPAEDNIVGLENRDVLVHHAPTFGLVRTLANEELNLPTLHSDKTASMTRILCKCRNSGVPIRITDNILATVQEEFACKCLSLNSKIPSSKTTLDKLKKMFPSLVEPTIMQVPLETVSLTNQLKHQPPLVPLPSMPVFEFVAQLQDLFDDPLFTNLDNLDVDPHNHWEQPLPVSSYDDYGDWQFTAGTKLKDGEWQHNCLAYCGPELPMALHMFLVWHTDKTGKGAVAPCSMEPFVFSLSITKENIRRLCCSWRLLGFVPKHCNPNIKTKVFGQNMRNYHRILDALFAPVVAAQELPPILRACLGDEHAWRRTVLHTNLLTGDGLNASTVAGRVGARKLTNRISHACHTPWISCDDPLHCCKFFSQEFLECFTLAALGPDPKSDASAWQSLILNWTTEPHTNAARKEIETALQRALCCRMAICQEILRSVFGQHMVDNVFYCLNLGDNPRGVTSVASSNPMHIWDGGTVPQFLEVIIDELPDSKKMRMDRLTERIFSSQWCRPGQRSDCPQIVMRNGFTTLSGLTCDQKMGKLLGLAIVAQTEEGRSMLEHHCSPDFDRKKKRITSHLAGTEPTSSNEEEDSEGECEHEEEEGNYECEEEDEGQTDDEDSIGQVDIDNEDEEEEVAEDDDEDEEEEGTEGDAPDARKPHAKVTCNHDDADHHQFVEDQIRHHGLSQFYPHL